MKSWMNLKMDYFWSKTRSLGQILEKPCVRSRGNIYSLIITKLGQNVCSRGNIISVIIMKLGQNVCLDEILDEFENG